MTSRKTQQEIEKTFKKVGEGIASFEGIYEKIKTTQNLTQRDKLEDQLKREIKKLQRFRDQIKTWAAGNEVKDKSPLLEQRRAIETCMEQFKAVEKEMKTKAYSKEGLSAAARLDPKDKEKAEMCDFLSQTVDILQQKVEAMEAEEEQIHASMKKGKKDPHKTSRLADIAHISERHRWHIGRLELLLRMLQNGNIETNQVASIKDSISYFAEDGHNPDFYGEDESIYEDLNLDEEEAAFGMSIDNDRVSSQDAQSLQDVEDDHVPPAPSSSSASATRHHPKKDSHAHVNRRPSTQSKSPLPVLSTLHMNPQQPPANVSTAKPIPVPARSGETLKYASAAAAAAASDKHGVGIAPLPPPPGAAAAATAATTPSAGTAATPATSHVPAHVPTTVTAQTPATTSAHASPAVAQATPAPRLPSGVPVHPSPRVAQAQPVQKAAAETSEAAHAQAEKEKEKEKETEKEKEKEKPPVFHADAAAAATAVAASASHGSPSEQVKSKKGTVAKKEEATAVPEPKAQPQAQPATPAAAPAAAAVTPAVAATVEKEEPIYHIPPTLQDLVQSFEATKSRYAKGWATEPPEGEPSTDEQGQAQTPSQQQPAQPVGDGAVQPSTTTNTTTNAGDAEGTTYASTSLQRLLEASQQRQPEFSDNERPMHYRPTFPYDTPAHYPQEPLPLFRDPRLFEGRLETDTLFYIFYYQQGTYYQYLAARSLKNQSWRFHKQYQTWFQRHEEPKIITEEFEQGTYRFFDYESTWMNRRKADFQFMYKFLEDDL